MLPPFKNSTLLQKAFIHRSALNEKQTPYTESNERMEFLGDAVLELATTKYLYAIFPTEPEGILTSYRSALVKTTTLAEVAENLGIGDQLVMSKGEETTGGRTNPSLLADAFEAVLGALFLDQGMEVVEEFLQQELFVKFDDILKNKLYKDSKSQLQEVVQALGQSTPLYEVVKEIGPDHDKEFTVNVVVENKIVGTGTGKSKQIAQQAAAQQALAKF